MSCEKMTVEELEAVLYEVPGKLPVAVKIGLNGGYHDVQFCLIDDIRVDDDGNCVLQATPLSSDDNLEESMGEIGRGWDEFHRELREYKWWRNAPNN